MVPKKVDVFVWRAGRERLPVLVELDKRGVDLDSVLCPLCGEFVETVDHALFSCKLVRVIWEKILAWWGIASTKVNFDSLQGAVSSLNCSGAGIKIWQGLVWISMYLIWKNRNQMVFKKSSWSPPVAVNDIQVKSFEWIAMRNKLKKSSDMIGSTTLMRVFCWKIGLLREAKHPFVPSMSPLADH
ncbi:uncharacterized protein [Rutidosis leptorrhynchoides]|uniref:uncharacterized protein n=1 Tax=Rutidosis leptorrhynchoides TaxID=125765 RepID=UPI003A9A217D